MAIKASAGITVSCVVDVAAVYRYYKLQSSTLSAPAKPTANPPGSGWVLAEPSYTSGSTNSLYFTDLTVFSDGTFAYSSVSLSSSYEAAKAAWNKAQNAQDAAENAQQDLDNLSIGGRNLLQGSASVSSAAAEAGWTRNSTSTSLELVEMNNESVIHFWGEIAGTKVIPTIVTRNVAPCEFGAVYIYSMDVMFDREVVTGSNTPNHFHAGARDTESLFNTAISGKLSGIAYTSFTPANGTTIPANTWHHCERVFTFPAAATTEGYDFPAIRPFVYGTVLAEAYTGTVNGWVRRVKIEKGNRATDWTPAPEDVDGAIQQVASSTEVIVGTQTAATGAWTGRASFTSLQDGQTIHYWLPFAGSGNATLNLTLPDGTTTGAKNVYINATSRCTTHIAAGNMVQMVYRENVAIGSSAYSGWWISRALNDNTYDRLLLNNNVVSKSAITNARLIVGDAGGYFHLAAGVVFNVNMPILYSAGSIAAGSARSHYLSYPSINLRTALTGNASDWAGMQYATVYLAGTLTGDEFTVAETDCLTSAPADETLTYISLGYLYSAYQMYLYPEHPMFRLVNGVLTATSQIAWEASVTAEQAADTAAEALEVAQETYSLVRVESDGLHVKGYQLDNEGARVLTGGEVLVSADGMNVIVGGQVYSRFASDYVEFGNYQLRRVGGGLAFKLRKES